MRGLEQLLDRALLIVRPRAPFARWAMGEDTDPALQDLRKNPAVYAVEPLDADDPRIVLQMHWRTIFEAELAVWDNDKSKWPRSRTLTMFQRWFEVDVCPLVVDLVPRPSPSRKPIAWVTDLTRYLGDSRQPVPDAPAPVRNLATFFGSITAEISAAPSFRPRRLEVRCRRKPGRRPCPGFIEAAISSDGRSIEWRCCICGDNGVLCGWRRTPWDRSPAHDTAPPSQLGPWRCRSTASMTSTTSPQPATGCATASSPSTTSQATRSAAPGVDRRAEPSREGVCLCTGRAPGTQQHARAIQRAGRAGAADGDVNRRVRGGVGREGSTSG